MRAAFGALIVQHPEEPSLAAGGAATEGELATRLGLPGDPGRGRGDHGRARHRAWPRLTGGAVHFAHVSTAEALALIRARQGRRPRRHLRHRPALFRPQRDRDRRLAHLRQALAAAARRGRPAGGGRRRSPTARSTRSPRTTSRATSMTSACRSRRRRRAAPGWRPCSRSRWRRCMAARCRSPARSSC